MAPAFRYARFDEYDRVRKFLDTSWARGHAYVRMPELFEWTFGRKNLWDRDGYSFAIAEEGDTIVGCLGGIPFLFNCLGRESRGVWLVNYLVIPEYRRGPTALQLLNMFRRLPYETVIAFGNDPRVAPLYRALGARILVEIPRHVVVLPGAARRMADVLCATYPEWSRLRGERLAGVFSVASVPAEPRQSSRCPPSAWDERDWPRIAAASVGASRNLEYLTWRYVNHPRFDYQFISIPEGERTGLLVWRLETIRQATPGGLEELDRIGRVVEFLPASRTNAADLMAGLLHALVEANAMAADYYDYHGQTRGWLGELGFRDVAHDVDGRAIPSRFQPLDGKGGDIQSAVFAQHDVPGCSTDTDCVWHWSKSDSDQDRPN